MTSTKDTIAGKAKQFVAEVIGDGELAEEGKRQEKQPDSSASEEQADITTIANNRN